VYGADQERAAVKLLLGLLLCVICRSAQAEEFVTKVIGLLDGDTVLIHHGGGMLKVRLVDIDAPEKDQPFGASSQRSLADMVLGKQVKFVSQAMDTYGRMIARLSVQGLEVNAEQIRLGMAWEYSHYHSNHNLIALEAEARAVPRGLWAQSAPTPPWEWRKQHVSRQNTNHPKSAPLDASCGEKRHCAQMTSCDEARHYLQVCGLKYLDGDGDGNPCEYLCNSHTAKQK
jgi:endonuclease YncB( thermonuclease family)